MKKFLLTLAMFICAFMKVNAQNNRCGTDAYIQSLDAQDAQYYINRQDLQDFTQQLTGTDPIYRAASIVVVPVVFHVLYANTIQNISTARIMEQLDVLNDDYARMNADTTNTSNIFIPVAANTGIQFCLAQRDPNGAATTGIIRTSTNVSCFGNGGTLPTSVDPIWNRNKYLNIYILNACSGLLGWAQLPGGSAATDAVNVLYSSVGGPNNPGTANPYHLGRTATHEVGHWFNLQHTFSGGCSGTNANNCSTAGDYCCDTPPTAGSNFGCPTNQNSCAETNPFPPPYTSNVIDQVENYMDYTDDPCMNLFTLNQAARMNAAITGARNTLLTSNGCVPVGIEEILDETSFYFAPNPSAGILDMQFYVFKYSNINLQVFNIIGELVAEEKLSASGWMQKKLDLTELKNGIYHLVLSSENNRISRKLIISR